MGDVKLIFEIKRQHKRHLQFMGMYILYFQSWKRDSQQQQGTVKADIQ